MKPFYQPKVIASALFASLLASLSASAARAGDAIFETNGIGTIGEYTTSGATVNASLISGLNRSRRASRVSGSDLFVANGSSATRSANTPPLGRR